MFVVAKWQDVKKFNLCGYFCNPLYLQIMLLLLLILHHKEPHSRQIIGVFDWDLGFFFLQIQTQNKNVYGNQACQKTCWDLGQEGFTWAPLP